MKPNVKIPAGLIFIVSLFCGNSLKAQNPTMDAQWTVKTNNGSQLVLELGIRTNTAHEHLGPATFIINFDHTSYVKFNGGNTGNGTTGTDFNWIDSFSPAVYTGSGTGTTVSQPTVGTININFDFVSGTGASISDTAAYTPVVDLIFAVSDPSQSTNITWNMNEASPPTLDNVFDDGLNSFDQDIFSNMTVNPLPVTLLNFSAHLENSRTVLSWTTASEINNNYFTVERSKDGLNFSPVLQVAGAGNSDAKNNYTGYDENPLSGVSYYRLNQIDFNGASKKFNMVAINNVNASSFEALKIINTFTNPQGATFSYSLPEDGSITIIVIDINGKTIHKERFDGKKGINKYFFSDAPAWKPGIYFITIYSQDQSASTKIFIFQ